MDAIEQGFLQALREDPLDRTTRLVYADWLDDRDDPRGGFLREEAELVALSPGEERWRELQARLGRAVMTFDPEWVTDVSLFAHHMYWHWRNLRAFKPYPKDRQSITRATRCVQWQRAITELDRRFARRFSALTGDDRFRIPLDYALFQIVFGSGWCRGGYDDGDYMAILSILDVRDRSLLWFKNVDECGGEGVGVHLSLCISETIGFRQLLCCDRGHLSFGSVHNLDHLSDPRRLGTATETLIAPSFLDFLRTIPP